jgi:hypothetical protein
MVLASVDEEPDSGRGGVVRRMQPLARRWSKPVLLGTSLAGIALVAYLFATVIGPGYDAYAYWNADLSNLYPATNGFAAYRYPPPFAQLAWPLGLLPWEVFLAIWIALAVAALIAVAGRYAFAALAFPPAAAELFIGNIHFPIAAAVASGFQWPAAWALILLTKPTCGVALLWFAWRRQWRSLAIALGATAAISLVSFLLAPNLWFEWINSQVLVVTTDWPGIGGPVLPRLIAATALVIIGAHYGLRWMVPIVVVISMPFVWWHSLAVLVAIIPLLRRRRESADPNPRILPGRPGFAASSTRRRSGRLAV